MIADKLGYVNVSANSVIKGSPAGLFGVVSTVTGGTITIYDNATTNSGNILYTKALTVGDVVHFGGLGIAAKNGLYATVSAGTFVVLYT